MKLTSKGRYAVTAMLDLALHTENGPVTLASISERQGISLSYLDESVDATRCGGRGDCHDGRRCLTHDLWTELSDQIHGFLSEISLGQLVEQGRAKQSAMKNAARQGIAVNLAPTGRVADTA
jgi:Rrf2 family iron-sulfur cluster assembly transcriptional regulator